MKILKGTFLILLLVTGPVLKAEEFYTKIVKLKFVKKDIDKGTNVLYTGKFTLRFSSEIHGACKAELLGENLACERIDPHNVIDSDITIKLRDVVEILAENKISIEMADLDFGEGERVIPLGINCSNDDKKFSPQQHPIKIKSTEGTSYELQVRYKKSVEI